MSAHEPSPKFPRLAAESQVRLRRDWSAIAWAGSSDLLVKIQLEAEQALARAYEQLTAGLDSNDPSEKRRAVDLGYAMRLQVTVTGNKGELTRSGDLRAVFAEMHLSEVETIEIQNTGHMKDVPRIKVRFTKSLRSVDRPVVLEVSGPDRQWVAGVFDLLQSEFRRSVPWWSQLRRFYASGILGLLLTYGLIGLSIGLSDASDVDLGLAIVGGGIFGFLFGGMLMQMLLFYAFPGFEVLEKGETPKGRRVLSGVIAASLALVSVAGLVLGIAAL